MAATITPQATESFSLPLPLFGMIKIGTLVSRDNDEFSMWIGADNDIAEKLKEKSLDKRDTDIQENTSDRKRFGEGLYEEWYAKDRTPFVLIHDATKTLAAFLWFGPKPLGRKSLKYLSDAELQKEGSQEKDEWHTISYRAYPPFRGKGIMTPFVTFSIDTYRAHVPGIRIWAGIDATNPASVALVKKLGFIQDEAVSDAERQVFVLPQ